MEANWLLKEEKLPLEPGFDVPSLLSSDISIYKAATAPQHILDIAEATKGQPTDAARDRLKARKAEKEKKQLAIKLNKVETELELEKAASASSEIYRAELEVEIEAEKSKNLELLEELACLRGKFESSFFWFSGVLGLDAHHSLTYSENFTVVRS